MSRKQAVVIRMLGAAALLGGVVGLIQSTHAADPLPDAEFKALVEEDAKNIVAWAEIGKNAVAGKDPKAKDKLKHVNRAVKSNALLVALAAQNRMTGKNAADDAKLAALRDAAVDIAKSVRAKKFDSALTIGKTLSPNMAAGKKKAAITPIGDLVHAAELDVGELMHPFRPVVVGGYGIEKEVQDNAQKKAVTPPDKVAMLADRVLLIADVIEFIEFPGANNKKFKKDWADFNKDTKAAATTLLAAARTKNAKDIQAAFVKLETSCVACHRQFKN